MFSVYNDFGLNKSDIIKEQDHSEFDPDEEIDQTNADEGEQVDNNDQQTQFVITVDSISRGVLLINMIGLTIAIMVFIGELGCFHYQNIYSKENGFNLRNLKSYKLKSIHVEPKTYNTIILTYQKNKKSLKKNRDKLHPVLKHNYDLYLS